MIDHSRLVGWSSLHPAHRQSLTPLCRRSGTVSSVPGPTAGWLDALSCDEAPCVDPRDRDRHPAPPCGAAGAPIGTPSTVSRSTGVASGRRALRATWFGSVARLAHRSRPGGRRRVRQHAVGEHPGQRRAVDSPCGSSSVATRDASDQFLPSHVFVRAPVPRRFPSGRTLARPPPEIPSASRQNESLRWVSRGPSSGFHRCGRCLPAAARESRTSDTPVAPCPEPVELALLTLSNRSPRPPRSARVNDANRKTIRGAFHRSRTFAPQRPLGRPAPIFTSPAAWPPRCSLPTPLHPSRVLWRSRESWAAVHVIPLPAGIALLSASVVARRLLQPFRRTGTPFELPILAREWSFRPAARLAPTDARLRRSLRCVAAPRTCEPRSAHAGFHSDVLRLRGRGESRAEALEQRHGSRALLTMSRVPFS
jgi:hypothetical protein